jgi:NAD(P)-dependent dehydrogenase (short-subunit alcohol dehydrogenase family)
MDLKGAVAIVTGASGGIGAATVARLAAAGSGLALAARNPGRLDRVLQECAAAGAEAIAIPTDVTRSADVDALVRATVARFGRLDVLVNAAGTFATAPSSTRTRERLRSPDRREPEILFLTCRAVLPTSPPAPPVTS